jgi:hypothetical protein
MLDLTSKSIKIVFFILVLKKLRRNAFKQKNFILDSWVVHLPFVSRVTDHIHSEIDVSLFRHILVRVTDWCDKEVSEDDVKHDHHNNPDQYEHIEKPNIRLILEHNSSESS